MIDTYDQQFYVDYFSFSYENIKPCETLVGPFLAVPGVLYYCGSVLYSMEGYILHWKEGCEKGVESNRKRE